MQKNTNFKITMFALSGICLGLLFTSFSTADITSNKSQTIVETQTTESANPTTLFEERRIIVERSEDVSQQIERIRAAAPKEEKNIVNNKLKEVDRIVEDHSNNKIKTYEALHSLERILDDLINWTIEKSKNAKSTAWNFVGGLEKELEEYQNWKKQNKGVN